MNLSILRGTLLVTRDPDITFKDLGDGKRIFFPDDMAGSNVNSWAASDRMSQRGFCHLHEPSDWWVHDPVLTGLYIRFEKWTERTFELNGHLFHVFDERSIVAYEENENAES